MAVGAGILGGVWSVFSSDDLSSDGGTEGTEQNTSDEKAAEQQRNESNEGAGGNTSDEQNTTQNGSENASNESAEEYPEAANPEPEPEGPGANESVINESRAGSGASASDVVISEDELVTASDGAAVVGVVRNEAAEPVTVELQATFYKNGKQVGRPALNGKTGLASGGTWRFVVRAMGSEFSGVTDYEIEKSVQTVY